MSTESKCPFHHTTVAGSGTTNRDWWPSQLKLELLNQHSAKSNPMGEGFNYAKEFKSLNLAAVKKDLAALDDSIRTGVQALDAEARTRRSLAQRPAKPAIHHPPALDSDRRRRRHALHAAASLSSSQWLVLIFASVGFNAPNNPVVVVTVVTAALVITTSLYVILDMDRPFEGPVRVSPAPMQQALDAMQR